MGWLTVLLICLVTYRTTRLVIKDEFPPVRIPREAVLGWLYPDDEYKIDQMAKGKDEPKAHWGAVGRSLHYLLTCPWCMSVWIAAGTAYVFTIYTSVPLPWATGIAAAAVTGLIFVNLDRD
jgi:hypothetical protein